MVYHGHMDGISSYYSVDAIKSLDHVLWRRLGGSHWPGGHFGRPIWSAIVVGHHGRQEWYVVRSD